MMNSRAIRVIDPILTNVVQGYVQPEYVGMVLFPQVPVQVSGGQVLEFGKESFKKYKTRRAPGAAIGRIQFGYLGKPFALVQDALEGTVPVEHIRDASRGPSVDLGSRAARLVMGVLRQALEVEQATLATNAANYDSNHKITLTGTDKWSDDSSSPGNNIENGKEAIRQSTGIYPNTLVLSAVAYKTLKNHSSILDRMKYTSRDSVTPEILASLWDLQKVVVGAAISFNDGEDTATDVWGDNAVLAYVPDAPSGMEQPSYGYTYTMIGNPAVGQSYYEENTMSWQYPVVYERIPVQSGILSGYLIQGPA